MEYLKVRVDFVDLIGVLTDEENSRLFKAMLRYAADGKEPKEIPDHVAFFWNLAKKDIDKDIRNCEIWRQNGSRGGRPKTRDNQMKPNETKDNQTKPNETKDNQMKPNETKDNQISGEKEKGRENEEEKERSKEKEEEREKGKEKELSRAFERFCAARRDGRS